MGRKEVAIIRKDKGSLIDKQSKAKYGVNFGHGKFLKHDACFARVHSRLSETPVGTSMQYILRYELSWNIFDYNSLFKELNKMFGGYFKISRHRCSKENVRIINIEEIGKFPDKRLRHIAYALLLVLFRSIDSEYIGSYWKPDADSTRKKIYPIKNWEDVLYFYYKFGISCHGVNDRIRDLKNSPKLYKASIKNYFKTIALAFGGGFDYSKRSVKLKTQLNGGFKVESYSWRTSQTPSFTLLEKIVKEIS